MARATSLLKAFTEDSIPPEGAFIITSRFDPVSPYSIYEITAYGAPGEIITSEEGFLFKADGERVYILVEPPDYPGKALEPLSREPGLSVPLRFSDLEIVIGKNNGRIMISAKPGMLKSSFLIPYTKGDDFAFVFYLTEDVHAAIRKFMADVFYNDSGLPREDALDASQRVLGVIKKIGVFRNVIGNGSA